jgi:hypothetical protein
MNSLLNLLGFVNFIFYVLLISILEKIFIRYSLYSSHSGANLFQFTHIVYPGPVVCQITFTIYNLILDIAQPASLRFALLDDYHKLGHDNYFNTFNDIVVFLIVFRITTQFASFYFQKYILLMNCFNKNMNDKMLPKRWKKNDRRNYTLLIIVPKVDLSVWISAFQFDMQCELEDLDKFIFTISYIYFPSCDLA